MDKKQRDRDSFASFTGGLRNNWIFVIALFGVGFWIVTNVNESKNLNTIQDGKIESTVRAIEVLTQNMNDLTTESRANVRSNDNTNSEILRRLDLVQKDIDFIKQQK